MTPTKLPNVCTVSVGYKKKKKKHTVTPVCVVTVVPFFFGCCVSVGPTMLEWCTCVLKEKQKVSGRKLAGRSLSGKTYSLVTAILCFPGPFYCHRSAFRLGAFMCGTYDVRLVNRSMKANNWHAWTCYRRKRAHYYNISLCFSVSLIVMSVGVVWLLWDIRC